MKPHAVITITLPKSQGYNAVRAFRRLMRTIPRHPIFCVHNLKRGARVHLHLFKS